MSSVADKSFFGHPKGLAILFFTEMWERFSYYGMRALLVLYLVANINDGGYGWTTAEALYLYGIYTFGVYIVSIPGGILADRLLGQKKSVMIGGFLLVIGHFLMAFTSYSIFITALCFIIAGTGLLKPNISTMVGGLYKDGDNRRDSGFMIFYMGINLGALLSGIVVGVVAKIYGWHMGFTLAGIGMLLGQVVFIAGQKHLSTVGNLVKKGSLSEAAIEEEYKSYKEGVDSKPGKPLTFIEKNRMIVMFIAFLVVVVFWMAFEQAGGLMNIYTNNATDRNFFGLWEIPAPVFQSLNAGFILIFGGIVASFWAKKVKKGKRSSSIYKMGIGTIILGLGFLFMVSASNQSESINLTTKDGSIVSVYSDPTTVIEVEEKEGIKNEKSIKYFLPVANSSLSLNETVAVTVESDLIKEYYESEKLEKSNPTEESVVFHIEEGENAGKFVAVQTSKISDDAASAAGLVNFEVSGPTDQGHEEIISIFSVKSAMLWLVLAYLLHTIGELCLSPVALSYITKLAPKRMVASMMGVYFAFTGCANYLAAWIGRSTESLGELVIFWALVIFPVFIGGMLVLASKRLEKLTHGAEEGQTTEPYPDEEWSVNPIVDEKKNIKEVM